jgi:hypothetical protein
MEGEDVLARTDWVPLQGSRLLHHDIPAQKIRQRVFRRHGVSVTVNYRCRENPLDKKIAGIKPDSTLQKYALYKCSGMS